MFNFSKNDILTKNIMLGIAMFFIVFSLLVGLFQPYLKEGYFMVLFVWCIYVYVFRDARQFGVVWSHIIFTGFTGATFLTGVLGSFEIFFESVRIMTSLQMPFIFWISIFYTLAGFISFVYAITFLRERGYL